MLRRRKIRLRRGGRGSLRGDRTGMFQHGNKFKTEEGDYPLMTSKEIIFGTNDYRDLYLSNFIDSRIKNNVSTITESICVRGNHKKVMSYVKANYSDALIFSAGVSRLILSLGDAIIEIESNSNTIDFRIHGTINKNAELRNKILESFEEISIYINWIYDSNMNRATVPIDQTLLPVDEMYPFLGDETLEEYYQRFMESRAGILILIGPPGTGKTSFIRGLLTSTDSSAMVTYDQKILSADGLFSEFVEGSSDVLVIEDADLFLSARKDGNDMMHRFLNVGDGLVTVKGKKIVFSTNLPSIKDIDDALLRPGRCFDILKFNTLDKEQAEKLAKKLNIVYTFEDGKSDYTIGEIFTGAKNTARKSPKSKFGFM